MLFIFCSLIIQYFWTGTLALNLFHWLNHFHAIAKCIRCIIIHAFTRKMWNSQLLGAHAALLTSQTGVLSVFRMTSGSPDSSGTNRTLQWATMNSWNAFNEHLLIDNQTHWNTNWFIEFIKLTYYVIVKPSLSKINKYFMMHLLKDDSSVIEFNSFVVQQI